MALSTVAAEIPIVNPRGMIEQSTNGFLWNATEIHNEVLLQHSLNRGVAYGPATMQSSKSFFSTLLLAFVLASVIVAPSILPARAATYTPALTSGQWAEYKLLATTCLPSGSPESLAQGIGGMSDTDYGLLKIAGVSGTNVTLDLSTAYTNGSNVAMQGWVDVASGGSSLTSLAGGSPSNYFILSGGLQSGDAIWSTLGAPVLNQTTTESILGEARDVNVLNYTHTSNNSYGQFSISTQFTFDKQYGILIDFSTSTSTTSLYGSSQFTTSFGMVANNIWRSDSLPDFTISNSGSIAVQAGSSGTTTLSLSDQYGFGSTINLQVTTQSGLTCTLDKTSVRGSGTATLSCTGQPGSYTVTITATSGPSTHTTQVPVQINPAATPNQPTNQSNLIYIGIGVAAAVAIAALASFLLLRRKKEASPTAPTETPPSLLQPKHDLKSSLRFSSVPHLLSTSLRLVPLTL